MAIIPKMFPAEDPQDSPAALKPEDSPLPLHQLHAAGPMEAPVAGWKGD